MSLAANSTITYRHVKFYEHILPFFLPSSNADSPNSSDPSRLLLYIPSHVRPHDIFVQLPSFLSKPQRVIRKPAWMDDFVTVVQGEADV